MSETTPTRQGLWFPKDVFLSTNGIRDWDIPRNGLVGLWDPYRDTYGRNFLPVGSDTFTIGSGWAKESGAESITVEGGYPDPDGGNNAYRITVVTSGVTATLIMSDGIPRPAYVTHSFGMQIKAVSVPEGNPLYVTIGGYQIASGLVTGDWGFRNCTRMGTTDFITYGRVDLESTPSSGQTVVFDVYHPQLNLGPTLFPYSAPSGAPGTLQTGTDYSGMGNHLTLGADTNASTDDPAYTGTSWLFDGGDYLKCNTVIPVVDNTPFCGFVVTKFPDDGEIAPLFCLNTGSAWGGTDKGFWLSKVGSTKKIAFRNYKSDYTYAATYSEVISDFAVYHYAFFGWDGASACLQLDGNALATTACATSLAHTQITQRLTLGAYPWLTGAMFAGEIAYAGFWPTRFLPSSERIRTYLNVKGLMASRGVTLA